MSYQVLARKWRPRNFNEVVGQQHVLRALTHALDQGRLHHAWLFSGTRGVGKTTIARLLAKGLNCEAGISSHPCGVCPACLEIDAGNHVDLLEIDAASRTKVEDTRDLLDNVQYRPARARFKIYLIDEVHMLSRHSFNALLKTLEEPPPYVKFILATTDPQKLPITVLSRCLQFHLKSLDRTQIIGQLQKILHEEAIPFTPEALEPLATAANGSLRDALSLTDQAIAYGSGAINHTDIVRMLGIIDPKLLETLLRAILAQDAATVLSLVAEIAGQSGDFDQAHQQLATLLQQVAMVQLLPTKENDVSKEALLTLAQQISAEELQLLYQIALNGRRDLQWAPDQRAAFEMTLLRMLAFSPRREDIPPAALFSSSAPKVTLPESPPIADVALVSQASSGSLIKTLHGAQPSHQRPQPQLEPELVHSPTQSVAVNELESLEALLSEQSALLEEAVEQGYQLPEPMTTPPAAPERSGGSSALALLKAKNQLRSQLRGENSSPVPSTKQSIKAPESRQPLHSTRPAVALDSRVTAKTPHPAPSQPPVEEDLPPWVLDEEEELMPPSHLELPEAPVLAVTKPQVSNQIDWDELEEAESSGDLLGVRLHPSQLLQQCGDVWGEWIARLDLGGRLRQLALNSCFSEPVANVITLYLKPEQRHLLSPKALEDLRQTLAQSRGVEVSLTIEIAEVEGETPLEIEQRLYLQKKRTAQTLFESDPVVVQLQQRFDAQIELESIEPLVEGGEHFS